MTINGRNITVLRDTGEWVLPAACEAVSGTMHVCVTDGISGGSLSPVSPIRLMSGGNCGGT